MSKSEKNNYTQLPNVILDEYLPLMGIAELKVVMFVARKTFGWQKEDDKISLSQMEDATGLSRQGVIDGVNAAIERGVLCRVQVGQGFLYHLNIDENVTSQASRLVKPVDQSSELTSQDSRLELVKPVDQSEQKLVKPVDTQKKDIKEIEQELDLQILTDGNTIQIVFNTPVYPERALLRNGKEVRISCRERVGNELYFNWEKIGIKKITIKSQTEILAYKSDDTLIENHPHVSSAGVLCLGSSFVAKRETIKEFINEFITMYQKINFMSSYHGIYDYVEGETTSLERESYKLPVNMFAV